MEVTSTTEASRDKSYDQLRVEELATEKKISGHHFCLLRLVCRFCFLRVGGLLSALWWRDRATKYLSMTMSCCCRRTDESAKASLCETSACCSKMIDWRQSLNWPTPDKRCQTQAQHPISSIATPSTNPNHSHISSKPLSFSVSKTQIYH